MNENATTDKIPNAARGSNSIVQKHRVRSRNHHPYIDNDQLTKPRRPYQIHFQSPELFEGKNERLVLNSSSWRTVARTNKFEVSGEAKLLPKEIAGSVVGSIAGAVLLAGLFVLGARIVRKRKTVAVDLPRPGDGGHRDVREASA
jgi:hypothetical protein